MRFSIILVVICCMRATGQVAPTLVTEQEKSFGIAMAVNPKNSKNIVVWASLKVWFTTDGGKTWEASSFNPQSFGLPGLVSDAKGNFFFADVTANPTDRPGVNAVSVFRSEDGGKTWSPPEVLHTSDQLLLYVNLGTHPKKEMLAVTWSEVGNAGDNCPGKLFYASSSNGGKKFSEPVVLGTAEGDCADNSSAMRSASPELLYDGKVFAAWMQRSKIMLDRSYDHNMWLRNDITVRDNSGSWMVPVPGLGTISQLPSLTIDNGPSKSKGLVSLIYPARHNGDGDFDILILRTGNRGDTWTLPARVDKDSTRSDQLMPRVTTDQSESVMYVLYFDRRGATDGSMHVYLAWSADGGTTFKEKRVSTEALKPALPENMVSLQHYSSLAAAAGVVTASWVQWDGEKSKVLCVSIPRADLEKDQ